MSNAFKAVINKEKEIVRTIRDAFRGTERQEAPAVAAPEDRRYTLKELLDGSVSGIGVGFTGYLSTSVFRNSPLRSSQMEARVLSDILINAHARKVPLAEAYAEVEVGTGEDYINESAALEGKPYHDCFRYDPEHPNRIYPGRELASFMTERVSALGYSPTGQ